MVLSRRAGDEIVIADDIHIKVVGVRGGRAMLAFEAPKEMRILRREILAPDLRSVDKDRHVAESEDESRA